MIPKGSSANSPYTPIDLKCENPWFTDVWNGDKPFEIRKDDRPEYRIGQILRLREFSRIKAYSGRTITIRFTYLMRDNEYVKPGFCVFGFAVLCREVGS